MSVLFKKILRRVNPADEKSAKRVYPMITYKYGTPVTLDDVAKEISGTSGVSEGETVSVLKDFRTQLKKVLLSGRAVNIAGLGYFYLAAHSDGTDKAEDFTASDISGLRICFRANKDIRITASGSTRSDGLNFKDVDRINDETSDDSEGEGDGSSSGSGNGGSSGTGGVIDDNPLG